MRRDLAKYSFPVLIALFTLTTLYNFDVLLVKHFFSESDAGLYTSASLIGKIVFFASLSIVMVMFPKVSEFYERNMLSDARRVLNISLVMTLILSLGITGFYLMFPQFVVLVLFGKQFLSISHILWIFALVYSMFSFIYSLCMYNLSIHRYAFIYFIILMNLVEVALIWLFHASMVSVLWMLAMVLFVTLLFLLVYKIGRAHV